ncbi:Outer membrane receptor proteins, mostly Fe transport [Cyclobacterium lianum]|uniref:Outer membrane receptor proteins, mostly Fe transport n=1 Tax=Cyclobacterium lianum TaxID=388280 RepID=A0A1M7PSY2_9BACT|nr:outer membrane beta-barrel protein [Cyclobacterium lianum]SHN20415.1 Outer membrane receptor proteins, mostly Fe transport [Cyclobacterium lianum]
MNLRTLVFATSFFYLIGWSHLAAQEISGTVSGTILDENREPLPFANVVLLEVNSEELVTAVISDDAGYFTLQTISEKEVFLRITTLGYTSYQTNPFVLRGGAEKNFGTIQVQAETTGLDEVTVNAARPNVLIQADKTIVNVAGTVMAEGNTVLDVVGRSPGVFVDADGNISLNGRSGVVVLIDERQTYMNAADLANFLRAMPADNILSIEVINNPPAKYDAEGAAGVINLVLKKNNINGTNGNVHLGSQYNGLHTPSAGATLNVKKNKWTSNASLNYSEWGRFIDLDIIRRFQVDGGLSVFDQEARLKLLRSNLFFSGGTDYQINEKHSIGINLQASGQKGTEDGNSLTNISNPKNSDTNYLNALNDSYSDNYRVFGNLHYIARLDTQGTKLSADLDFTQMDAGSLSMLSNSYWTNELTGEGTSDRIRTGNEMLYTIYTAKADFTRPLGKDRELEAGLKGSWVNSDNKLDISKSVEEGVFNPDPNSNHFIYKEQVLAAYTSYKGPISEQLNFQAGLRAEYADIEGNSVSSSQINTQEYLNLFPSLYLQHQVNDNYQIVYNLNRRITRPHYRQLNPYVFYIDPLTTEEGNPQLRPQYANNFEMNHIIKNAYQLAVSFSQTENAFGQIMVQDEETRKTRIQMQNLDRTQNLSVRATIPFEFASWYSTSNMLQFDGNTFQSQLGAELLDEKQFSFMARSQHNITLPKGFRLELVGIYRSPFRDGQLKIDAMSWMDAGLTKTFYNDKLSLTVNGADIFRTMKFRGNIDFHSINTDVRQYNSMQSVRFTLRWKFARGEQFKVSQRSGSTEERNRLD